MRYDVVALEPQTRGGGTHLVERCTHRAVHEVRVVDGHDALAVSTHHDLDPGPVHDLRGEAVAVVERQAEGVEAGAEVRARRGDGHGDRPGDERRHPRRPAAFAAAVTSASTTVSTRSVKVDSAVSMSLRPWPVTVTTSVLPS